MANARMRGRPIAPLVSQCAGTGVFGEAGSSSPYCPVAI